MPLTSAVERRTSEARENDSTGQHQDRQRTTAAEGTGSGQKGDEPRKQPGDESRKREKRQYRTEHHRDRVELAGDSSPCLDEGRSLLFMNEVQKRLTRTS